MSTPKSLKIAPMETKWIKCLQALPLLIFGVGCVVAFLMFQFPPEGEIAESILSHSKKRKIVPSDSATFERAAYHLLSSERGDRENFVVLCSVENSEQTWELQKAILNFIYVRFKQTLSTELLFSENCEAAPKQHPAIRAIIALTVREDSNNYLCFSSQFNIGAQPNLNLVYKAQLVVNQYNVKSMMACPRGHAPEPMFPGLNTLTVVVHHNPTDLSFLNNTALALADLVNSINRMSENFHLGSFPWISLDGYTVVSYLLFEAPIYIFLLSVLVSGVGAHLFERSDPSHFIWELIAAIAILPLAFPFGRGIIFCSLLCSILYIVLRRQFVFLLACCASLILALYHASNFHEEVVFSFLIAAQFLLFNPIIEKKNFLAVAGFLLSFFGVFAANYQYDVVASYGLTRSLPFAAMYCSSVTAVVHLFSVCMLHSHSKS